ncbi:CBS domain-containing protein [Microbacterium sp. APC 3898]|uniref:CBS domain-containing protein n=2 Tax=Planococcus TaxID=1372 RepID=A0ABT7ZGH3_9BACL|nr:MULTISPECIES: CBS domain-containing protein [Terrabacteria group]MBD8014022.1 CBS domain-containing protein [Planococcus wigleyi]MDN3426262.1 CBS domain-containing protein [Planococcus sp. APC 4016]MDN3438897.1 CBS domain-containing protein [Planococcus sp. APC 3900]MDN3497958.1 CBS domain-containing protein [Microbacterium sp. APC 3898]
MFVKSVMVKREKCHTVQLDDSVQVGFELLEKYTIDALPVVEGTEYKGIFTWYYAYRAFFHSGKTKEEFAKTTKVRDVIVNEDVYLNINDVYEKALVELNDFPIIAVVEDHQFLGIVTRFDVVNQLQSAFGMDRPGYRITFTSVESEGRIGRLGEIIEKFKESVVSLVTFDETNKMVRRIVLKIEKKDNIDRFVKELEKSGFRVLDIAED